MEMLFEEGTEVVPSSMASGSHDLCAVEMVHGRLVDVGDMVLIVFLCDSSGSSFELVVVEYVAQISRAIWFYSIADRMNSTVVVLVVAGVPLKS